MKKKSSDNSLLLTIGSNALTLGLLLYIVAALDHKFSLFETREVRNVTLYIVSGIYASATLGFHLLFKDKKNDKEGELP